MPASPDAFPDGRFTTPSAFLAPLLCLLTLLSLAGCGGRNLQAPSSSASEARMLADIRDLLEQRHETLVAGSCRRSFTEEARDACYRYSPAPQRQAAQPGKNARPLHGNARGSGKTAAKATAEKAARNTRRSAAKPVRGGLCQPQCLIYVRCRTGFKTCMMGNTTSVSWAACARQNGALSSTPVAGSAMLIDRHKNISSGHVIFVEEACRLESGNWLLRISHSNFDGKCLLDLDSKALFFPKTRQLSVLTGPWGCWARELNVLGFVTR